MVYEDEARCIAVHGNIVVTVEDVEPSIQFLHEITQHVQRAGRENAQGLGLLIVISSRCKAPSEEARAKIHSDRLSFGQHVRCAAHVVYGEGFMAAAKRSVLALLTASSRSTFPLKVFGDLSPALLWLLQTMGDAAPQIATARELERAVATLARRHFRSP